MAEYKTFSFYLKKYWPYILIYFFSALILASLWGLAFYYLKMHTDLISNKNLAIIRYDIMLGPVLIGHIEELWKLVYLASILFIINTILILIFKFIEDFYLYLIVIYNFLIQLFLGTALGILILINLK